MSRLRMKNARYSEKNILQRHIYEHKAIYLVLLILFFAGFIIGSINAAFVREEIRTESQNYILNFVQYLKTQEIDSNILLRESITANIKPVVYIMLFGLVFIGIPFIFIYIGLYSYSIGFTVTSIIAGLGVKQGSAFILTLMLPQEIVLLPTIFVIGVNAILFSKVMLKINNRSVNIKKEFLKYTMIFVIGLLIALGISLFETYIGSSLTKMAIKLVA